MKIEQLQPADLPALLHLCEAALPLDTFSLDLLHTRLLGEPNPEQAIRVTIRDGDRLLGAMTTGMRGTGEDRFAVVNLFAVHPDARRRGLATALLEETETRVLGAGFRSLRVGRSAPIYFWPGVDVRYTPALCLLQRHEYARSDEGINMYVDLHASSWNTEEAEAALAVDGYEVRRLRPDDREQFSGWLREVWGPTWEYEATASLQNDPVSTWLATRNGQICAFASYNVTAFPNGFGPTGTDEALRGRGLGRVLFYRCMSDLRHLGHSECEVCWVGPVGFYARVADAWIHRVFWSLEKQL